MPLEFGRKWGTSSAYPAVCGIQREADFDLDFFLFKRVITDFYILQINIGTKFTLSVSFNG